MADPSAQPSPPAQPSMRSMAQGSPHAVALGLQVVSAAEDGVVTRCPYRAELVGDPDRGVIAGGVVTSLLDHSCGHAVAMALPTPGPIVTLDLRIDYMRAARPGLDLFAHAQCYRLTRTVGFVRATAHDGDPADPVATAQAAFVVSAG